MPHHDLEIRPFQPTDEAAVTSLWERVFPDNPKWSTPADDIRRKGSVQPELFLVGERQGVLVGTVLAGFDGHRGWMHRVAVDPAHQRRGIGAALMRAAEEGLAALGCPKVNLQVRATNLPVIAFYERIGYALEERASMGKRLVSAAPPLADFTPPGGVPVCVVDAFTEGPFRGNPAAVCLLDAPAEEIWMQHVAAEMNHAETAFVVARQGKSGFELRWFTPRVEVDLCGHATLAGAHVLWETGRVAQSEPISFQTRSGLLTCRRAGTRIEMDFPREEASPATLPAELARALGVKPLFVGRNRFDYLIEVESAELLRQLEPDFRLLRGVATRGMIVTARADGAGADFVSRFFAPAVGIDEDPVTGSAHCCLGPYWSDKLQKRELVGSQASARGGTVYVRIEENRVTLGGHAVTTLSGKLRV